MKVQIMKKALTSVILVMMGVAVVHSSVRAEGSTAIAYRTVKIENVDIFYREAGNPDRPTILLLHGFPTSSHMFRNLIPALADQYHLVAPDYPGYGFSSMPKVEEFDYSFDNTARLIGKFIDEIGLDRYSLYLMDYGAPVGFRIAAANPDHFWEPIQVYWKDRGAINKGLDNDWWKNVKAAYNNPNMSNDDALRFLLTLGATKWQYTNGMPDVEAISPDNWGHVQPLLDREGNQDIQLQMFYSYGSNPPLYPAWQKYLRENQPPTLIVWGKNDEIFPAAGAAPYKRDLKDLEYHLIDTGHFALESHNQEIADLMRDFLNRKVDSSPLAANKEN